MWLLLIACIFFSNTEVCGMGAALQAQVGQLQKALSESQAKLVQLQGQKGLTDKRLEELTQGKARLETEIAQKTALVEQLEQARSTQMARLQQITDEKNQLLQQVAETSRLNVDLQNKTRDLQQQTQSDTSVFTEISQMLSVNGDNIPYTPGKGQLRRGIRDVISEKDALRETCQRQQGRINEITPLLEEQKRLMEEQRQRIRNLEEQVNSNTSKGCCCAIM